jgi:hypothetical protein
MRATIASSRYRLLSIQPALYIGVVESLLWYSGRDCVSFDASSIDVDMNRAVRDDLRGYTIVRNIASRCSYTIATQPLAFTPAAHAVVVGCRVPSPGNYHVPELQSSESKSSFHIATRPLNSRLPNSRSVPRIWGALRSRMPRFLVQYKTSCPALSRRVMAPCVELVHVSRRNYG